MAYYSTAGQFGGSPYTNPQINPWGSSTNTQGQQYLNWYAQQPQQNPYNPGSVNAQASISSAIPLINEQRDKNFAAAAARIGRVGGALGGSPYATALGNAARGASNDFANLAANTALDASKFNAGQQQNWAMNQYNQGLGAANAMRNYEWQGTQLANQNSQDWWNRYYDWTKQGGSPEYMNWWQQQGGNLANQFNQVNPWG